MTSPAGPDRDFFRLLSRLDEGLLAPAEVRALESRLRADASLRRDYLDFMFVVGGLSWERRGEFAAITLPQSSRHTPCAVTESEKRSVVSGQWSVVLESPSTSSQLTTDNGQRTISPIPHSSSLARRPLAFSLFVSTVATVVFLMLAAQIHVGPGTRGGSQSSSSPLVFVAQLTAEKDCRWGERSEAVFAGAHLRSGQVLDLKQGLAEVKFNSGAVTLVEGPAVLTLDGDNRGRLELGKLVGRVEKKSAQGFAIETPAATIVDLGTEFGVSVARDGELGVIVMKGSVRVEPRAAGQAETSSFDPAILAVGQSLSIRPSETDSPQITYDAIAENRFIRKIARSQPPPQPVPGVWDGDVDPTRVGYVYVGDDPAPLSASYLFNSPPGLTTQERPMNRSAAHFRYGRIGSESPFDAAKGWHVEFHAKGIENRTVQPEWPYQVAVTIHDTAGRIGICLQENQVLINPETTGPSNVVVPISPGFHTYRVVRRAGNTADFEVQIDDEPPLTVVNSTTDAPFRDYTLYFGDQTYRPGVGRAVWDYIHIIGSSDGLVPLRNGNQDER